LDKQQVEQCIVNSIWADVYGTPRPKDNKVHIGSITHACHRRNCYACTVPVTFFNVGTTMNFWYGNLVHSRPLLCDSTQEMIVEFEGVCGHVDEFCSKTGVMLEKKTTSTYPSSVYPSHKLQAEYYYALLKQLGFRDVSPYVVYFLKSMDPILPQIYSVDTRGVSYIINEIRAKRDIVLFFREQKKLPPPLYGDECGTCPYPSLCFGNLTSVRE